MLTKSTDCGPLRKPARQGSKLAKKGVYPVVNDRILQAKLTNPGGAWGGPQVSPSSIKSGGMYVRLAFFSTISGPPRGPAESAGLRPKSDAMLAYV